jgi:hypothetical protein
VEVKDDLALHVFEHLVSHAVRFGNALVNRRMARLKLVERVDLLGQIFAREEEFALLGRILNHLRMLVAERHLPGVASGTGPGFAPAGRLRRPSQIL